MPFRIFISYRRNDADFHVGRLRETLCGGVGGRPGFAEDQIFMDVDTIEPGVDFRDAIRKALVESDVFLAVIGPNWLSEENRRRLQAADDFVRFEIEAAFERAAEHDDVRIIPTLVHGAEMPRSQDLPEELEKLTHRHAFELTDRRWSDDIGKLFAALKAREQQKTREVEHRRRRLAAEQAQQAERERAEREAAELAAAEQAKREQAERERAERERAERERAEREAAEREAAELAAAEQAKREQAERRRAERERPGPDEADREAAERRERLRRIGAIASVLVIGTVAVVGAVLMGGSSDDGGGSRQQGALAWTRVADSALGGGRDQEMSSIVPAAGGATLLAGGYDASSGERDAAVWLSKTGRTWSRADDIAAQGDQAISSVATIAGEAVAVGADESQGDRDVAVWRSTDEERWESLGGRRLTGTDETVNRLTTGTPLGAVGGGWQTGDAGDDAAVWLFAGPGETVQADAAPISTGDLGGPGDQRIRRIVSLPDAGPLVAVGYAAGDAGVWVYSEDADAWQRVEDESLGGDGDQEMLDAAMFDGKVVAIGVERRNGDTTGGVWLSDDGTGWTRVQDTDGSLSADPPVSINRVVGGGTGAESSALPGLIAAGSAAGDAAVWTSQDGTGWKREPRSEFAGSGEQTVHSMRVKADRLIAVGSSGAETERDAAVWLGSPPS